ncbi:MAG: hypothetical protein AAF799_08935 [Myxococcota bacterium]
MLDAGSAPRRIGGLTIFEDHADPLLFYVLPEIPRVVANPSPALSLLLFRGDQAGAMLHFESQLAPTQEQLDLVRDELTEQGQAPRLHRPDWRDGTVRVAGWLDADELGPVSLNVGTPSLIGDPSSIVAARLDQHGAALAEQALRGGDALPTVLLFQLEFLGLGGPLGIEAEADVQSIFDHFSVEGAAKAPFGKARLAKSWEELVNNGLIRLEVIDESGELEGRRAEALSRVGQELVSNMFTPMPPVQMPRVREDGTAPPYELSFRLVDRREELTTTARWSFRERAARRITHHAAASLIGILGDSPVDDHISYVDLGTPSREIVVRAEPELAELAIATLDVELRLEEPEAPPSEEPTDEPEATPEPEPAEEEAEFAVMLDPETLEATLALQRDPGQPLWYRVRARFDPERTRADDRQTEWTLAHGGLVVVSPRRLFPQRELTVVAGHLELDWLDHIEVVVQPPDPEEPPRSVMLSGEQRTGRASFPAAGEQPLTLTTHYRGREGEPSRSDEPFTVPASEELAVIDGPFGPSLRVLVARLPRPGLLSAVTEFELSHEDWTQTASVSFDDPSPTTATQTVVLRRLRDTPDEYRHRTTLIFDDGRTEVGTWASSDKPSLVIGADGPSAVHRTQVLVLGGGPNARGSFLIELVLSAGNVTTSALIEGDATQAELVLVAPEGSAAVLTVREITNTGHTHEQQFSPPPAMTVLPPKP